MTDYFIIKVLWLCFVSYFLVRDSIQAYQGILKEKTEDVPSKIAWRVVNVILAIALLFN